MLPPLKSINSNVSLSDHSFLPLWSFITFHLTNCQHTRFLPGTHDPFRPRNVPHLKLINSNLSVSDHNFLPLWSLSTSHLKIVNSTRFLPGTHSTNLISHTVSYIIYTNTFDFHYIFSVLLIANPMDPFTSYHFYNTEMSHSFQLETLLLSLLWHTSVFVSFFLP